MANDQATREELNQLIINQFGDDIITFGPLAYEGTQHGYSDLEAWSCSIILRSGGTFPTNNGEWEERLWIINGPLRIILHASPEGTRFGTAEEAAAFSLGLYTVLVEKPKDPPLDTTPSA